MDVLLLNLLLLLRIIRILVLCDHLFPGVDEPCKMIGELFGIGLLILLLIFFRAVISLFFNLMIGILEYPPVIHQLAIQKEQHGILTDLTFPEGFLHGSYMLSCP